MRPAVPIPCPDCDGLATRVQAVYLDPDPPRGRGTVLRLRRCLDCGELFGSREDVVPVVEVYRRATLLAAERSADSRAMRRAAYPAPRHAVG